MKKFKTIALILMAAMVLSTASAFACTGMYVGKDVSKSNNTIIARSEDQSGGLYNKMFKVRPRTTKAGRYMVDTGEGQDGFKVPLPKTTYKYTYVPDYSTAGDGEYSASCMNEYGLAVVGTISASASDEYYKLDPLVEKGLREAILPGLIACQCKSAKGAVNKLAQLIDKYGSEEGNVLFFSDKKEAWIFEVYGGHEYCAMKMPTDKVAVFGNQFMIGKVDKDDTANFVFSDKLFEIMDKLGAVKEDGYYNVVKTVAEPLADYSNMRTWRGHQILAPSTAGAYDTNKYYDLFYTPDYKVSALDLMELYRDRYQGTEFDMALNPGNRPIGVTRQSDVHIIETFANLPTDTCQLQWLCSGCAEGNVFIPAFSGITDTYKAYKVDGEKFNANSAYFTFRQVSALAQSDRDYLMGGVHDFYKAQEEKMYKDVYSKVSKIKKEYKKSKKAGRKYVTNLAKNTAKKQIANAKKLYKELVSVQIDNINDRGGARKTVFKASF